MVKYPKYDGYIFLNFVSRPIDIGYTENIWTIYSNILEVEVNFKIRFWRIQNFPNGRGHPHFFQTNSLWQTSIVTMVVAVWAWSNFYNFEHYSFDPVSHFRASSSSSSREDLEKTSTELFFSMLEAIIRPLTTLLISPLSIATNLFHKTGSWVNEF